jgi:pimeloyl-ACP methyl ester carboxylesterase
MSGYGWKDMKVGLVPVALSLLFHASTLFSQTISQPEPAQPALRARVIVFVHGLHGSRESWRAANGAYWPDMIRTDPRFAYSDVDVAEYPTPDSNGRMSSVQLAEVLWNRLNRDHVWDHREVVFIAHSLGGILVEVMLLRHPADAAKVRFIVSYGTPHEGSPIARIASIYDKDPLLNDLSDADDNTFLTQLENNWRASSSVNRIHRFCAYEGEDTTPDNGFGRYLKVHARVVDYYSATYGCDVTTPPVEIHANHLDMVRPLNRKSAAYEFFYRVYRANPILEEQVVTREVVIPDMKADCDQVNTSADYEVPITLDSAMQERVVAASASWIDAADMRDVNPNPPAVARVDPDGTAHVIYGFRGPRKKLFVCLGPAHASLRVEFSIDREVPIREPQH